MMPVAGEYWPGSFSHGNGVRGVSEDWWWCTRRLVMAQRYVMLFGMQFGNEYIMLARYRVL
jgi:hypothetical protein